MFEDAFSFIHKNVALNLKTPIVEDGNPLSIGEVLDKLNDLNDEKERLKSELYAEKTNTAEVINEYSMNFKRHSKEFSFMIDLASDLGVDISKLRAKDD